MQQIHLWTGPDTSNIGHRDEIHQLCVTTLEAIHEADRLFISPNVVDIKRQSSDEELIREMVEYELEVVECELEVVG